MARWLSDEWFERARSVGAGLPPRPGASARIQYEVSGGPDGDAQYFVVVEDGRVVEAAAGRLAEADATFAVPYAEARRIEAGELDPNAVFMQGRLKVTGDMARVLAYLPVAGSDAYRRGLAEVAADTEFV